MEDSGNVQPWRPSPFVTHEHLAPIHQDLGRVKAGHESLERRQDTLEMHVGTLGAEMRTGHERILQAVKARPVAAADESTTPTRPSNQIAMSVRSFVLLIGAVVAGAVLGALMLTPSGQPIVRHVLTGGGQ